jgi:hypothetical protein
MKLYIVSRIETKELDRPVCNQDAYASLDEAIDQFSWLTNKAPMSLHIDVIERIKIELSMSGQYVKWRNNTQLITLTEVTI